MSLFVEELRVAQALAREAGALALGYQSGALRVEMKPGDEPVTVADRKASDLIVDGLARAFADDVIISEEHPDDLRRLHARRVWYVDPIDGTKDFIRGEDGFSVMIGLAVEHRPVMGVVYKPVGERMFYCDGAGAFYQLPGEGPQPLATSNVSDITAIRMVASRSHRTAKIDKIKRALGISDELNIGSVGLKLCVIALGERDLYVNPSSHCKSWDTCAPEAILVAAGGRLSDVHGKSLRYDREDKSRRSGLVASNGLVHDAVIDKMAPLFANTPRA